MKIAVPKTNKNIGKFQIKKKSVSPKEKVKERERERIQIQKTSPNSRSLKDLKKLNKPQTKEIHENPKKENTITHTLKDKSSPNIKKFKSNKHFEESPLDENLNIIKKKSQKRKKNKKSKKSKKRKLPKKK